MFEITYPQLLVFITAVWIAVRAAAGIKSKKVSAAREALLLTVYVCIIVIARLVYFPFHPVGGKTGTLKFDGSRLLPLWLNLRPFVHMTDRYAGWRINLFGNIAMFIPVGIVWPLCFEKLRTFGKTVLAGAGFSAFIEITQLLFYERSSDIDDLILNTAGAAAGALIYFGIRRITRKKAANPHK